MLFLNVIDKPWIFVARKEAHWARRQLRAGADRQCCLIDQEDDAAIGAKRSVLRVGMRRHVNERAIWRRMPNRMVRREQIAGSVDVLDNPRMEGPSVHDGTAVAGRLPRSVLEAPMCISSRFWSEMRETNRATAYGARKAVDFSLCDWVHGDDLPRLPRGIARHAPGRRSAHHSTTLNAPEHAFVRDRCVTEISQALGSRSKHLISLVEPRGIEPLTSAVRLQRSPI